MEAQEPKRARRRWIVWTSIGLVVVAGVVGGAFLARNANGNAKKK